MWKVVKELLEKYKRNNNVARVEAQIMMLSKVSMMSDDDPSILFEQISQIQNHFGMAACTYEDGDLILTVIAVVPSKYQSIVAAEQQIQEGTVSSRISRFTCPALHHVGAGRRQRYMRGTSAWPTFPVETTERCSVERHKIVKL